MHHPWRWIGQHLPGWNVEFDAGPLADDMLGGTDASTKTIYVRPGMRQRQTRCVVDHEGKHAFAGDVGEQPAWREREIDQASARDLIPFHMLADVFLWTDDLHEAAEELWVSVDTLQCRLDNLTEAERRIIDNAHRARDFHEEGQP